MQWYIRVGYKAPPAKRSEKGYGDENGKILKKNSKALYSSLINLYSNFYSPVKGSHHARQAYTMKNP